MKYYLYREINKFMARLKPSFFIIGERKCGTSSLYRYLVSHPNVLPCRVKEPNFFSQSRWKISLGYKKYLSLFPEVEAGKKVALRWIELDEKEKLYEETIYRKVKDGVKYITGEASVNTFYYANPKTLKRYLPNAMLILMLRNPSERTFSHYRMLQRFKAEGRKTIPLTTFEEDVKLAIAAVNNGGESAFLSPSVYSKKLPKWLETFGSKQLHIIPTERMLVGESALEEMNKITDLLSIPKHDFVQVINTRHNAAVPAEMPKETKELLDHFFEPYNKELNDLIEKNYASNHHAFLR